MKDLFEICGALQGFDEKPIAVATVIHVEGSAYRRAGARMLVDAEGNSRGMISGGCLEHDVFRHTQETLRSGVARTVRYDSTSDNDILFGTGLGCRGVVDVFVEPVTRSLRQSFCRAVETCRAARQPSAIATLVSPYPEHAHFTSERWEGRPQVQSLLTQMDWTDGEPQLRGKGLPDDPYLFVQPVLPPPQLVIFGAWLDAVPLIHLAKGLGFQVIVINARKNRDSLHLFQEADSIVLCSPAEALQEVSFDCRTFAVLMNHHFERDLEALGALAQVSIPFLGMLGPKKRQRRLLDAMTQSGLELTKEFESCLHGPVGLDVGANSPEEIALSIMAEVLSVLNGRSGRPNRDRVGPMHLPSPSLAYA